MKTTEYSINRAITQILSSIAIILNIIFIGYVYSSNIENVEYNLNTRPSIYFSEVSLYINAINILFFIIIATSITSKQKIWMTVCKKMMYTYLSFSICTVIYFYFFYINSITNTIYIENSRSQFGVFTALLRRFGFSPVNNSLVDGFKSYMDFTVNIFSIIQLATAAIIYAQMWLFKITIKNKLEEARAPMKATIRKSSMLGCTKDMQMEPVQAKSLRIK
ncbi:hypothetical protein GINT2_000926 [Glugoides intestinalis]